jgi:hypothetical protein
MSAEGTPGDGSGDEKDGDDRARRVRGRVAMSGRAADPATQAAADVKRLLADAAGLRQVVDLAEAVTMEGDRENGMQGGAPCDPDARVSDRR